MISQGKISLNTPVSQYNPYLSSLKGYLSSAVWISIEQSVMVSNIVYVFLGFAASDWSCAVELTNYVGPHWA